MIVGNARIEVRPSKRAGIGVGDVDLDLRDEHENGCCSENYPRIRGSELIRSYVHMDRLDRICITKAGADGQHGQQAAC